MPTTKPGANLGGHPITGANVFLHSRPTFDVLEPPLDGSAVPVKSTTRPLGFQEVDSTAVASPAHSTDQNGDEDGSRIKPVVCSTPLSTDEILGTLGDDDGDYDDERKPYWYVDKDAIMQAHLTSVAVVCPSFTKPRAGVTLQEPHGDDEPRLHNTDGLQSLSWNPGPPWEGDPAAVAAHIAGPWPHCRTASACSTWLLLVTAPLSSTRRRSRQTSLPNPYSSWPMVMLSGPGRLRRLAEGGRKLYFTIMNIHVKNSCAIRRSVCIGLFLMVRCMCTMEGVTLLSGVQQRRETQVVALLTSGGSFCPQLRTVAMAWHEPLVGTGWNGVA